MSTLVNRSRKKIKKIIMYFGSQKLFGRGIKYARYGNQKPEFVLGLTSNKFKVTAHFHLILRTLVSAFLILKLKKA